MFRIAALSITLCLIVAATEMPLRFLSGRGCAGAGDGIRLWDDAVAARNTDLIYAEAETAEKLSFKPGKGPVRDAASSGGAYIWHVTHAEFPLRIPREGRYRGWARSFLPFKGSWNHRQSMDGGPEKQVSESAAGVFGRWVWTSLGTFPLRAGNHRFVLHNWLGGARLDAIMFTSNPDFDPAGLAGFPGDGSPAGGTVETDELAPAAIEGLTRLAWAGDPGSGRIRAEISRDGGRTWTPVPADGDLRAVKLRRDGTDRFRFRFHLLPPNEDGPASKLPVLRSARVELTLDENAEIELENRHYRISFCRRTGGLAGIYSAAVGAWITPQHETKPFVGLGLRTPGGTEIEELPADRLRLVSARKEGRGVRLEWTTVEQGIRVIVTVRKDRSALSRWTCRVENTGPNEVVRIDFPLLDGVAVGDYRDDECVFPRTGGIRIKNPARSRPWQTTYLGGGSMSWMDVGDATGGLYLCSQDKTLRTMEMHCAPGGNGESANLAFKTHTRVPPGGVGERQIVIGVHAGDWHWAADRYREWAYSWMKHPDDPEWVKWIDGWCGASGTRFDAMQSLARRAAEQGMPYLQYWAQMADGIDQCCGNFYWPAPALGGEEGFRNGTAAVHAIGGRVTAYMNCQTWTRDSAVNDALRQTPKDQLPQKALDLIRNREWFDANRLYRIDGSAQGYYEKRYGWFIMCPASEGFRDHLKFWIVNMYGADYGLDGIYLDQTGATRAKPCYNLNHGHDDIGDWGQSNVELLRQCVEEARRFNPDFIMSIEGAGDALGQYASLHLISGLCTDPEIYHYTFPDHILISGYSNNSPLNRWQRVARAFLNGDRFDGRIDSPNLIDAVRLRQRVKWWLYPGRFMDTVGLAVSNAEILARWTLRESRRDRAIVFSFDNEQEHAGATCTLDLPRNWRRRDLRLFIFDLNGGVTLAPADISEGRLTFPIPAAKLSTALLMWRTTPARQIDALSHLEMLDDSTGRIELSILGYAERTQSIALTIDMPQNMGGDTARRLLIKPDAISEMRIPVQGLDRLVRPAIVTTTLAWPGGKRVLRTPVRPLLLNGTMQLNAEGSPNDPDYWSAGGTTSKFDRGLEDGAVWIQGQPDQYQYLIQHVRLLPETTYRFTCRIKRNAQSRNVSAAVVEFLGKGGYRVHGVGEKGAVGTWERFATTFTTGDDADRYSVYLYNTHGEARAWYDDITLRQVR